MIRRVETQYAALVLFFTFCQVIGAMCGLSDLLMADSPVLFVEEGMTCPMDGRTVCPPSLTSSPERHVRHSFVADCDHAMIQFNSIVVLAIQSDPPPWSWSSAYSLVPISIESSSVLRI